MNILLVDDDKLFIRKVIEGIDWDNIGIHRVFSAEDMQQACRILETFSIDIMVTDVEMPRGNGLELLEWITERKYSVDSLVVSGYAHFAYVQKAMEFGTKRYLLKPVSNKELSNVLSKIVEQRKQRVPEHKKNFTHSWKEILNSVNSEKKFGDELREKKDLYSPNESFCIAMLRILTEQKRGETEQRLLMFVIQNVILEFFEESSFDLECIRRESEEEWLLLLRKNKEEESVNQELTQIQNYLKETAQLTSCVYISSNGGIEEMLSIYARFGQLCSQIVFEEQGIICQDEWEQSESKDIEPPCFEKLEEKLDLGEIQQVKEELDDYICTLVKMNKATRICFRDFLESMTGMVHRFLEKNNLSFYQMFEEEQYDKTYRQAATSVLRMKNFIEYLMRKLDGVEEIGDKKKQLVELLKWYISEHISEELTRKKLAQSIHFSEDYVARIFKAGTGKSISTYVMEQRMELAKNYLTKSNMSISDVAMMVGYNNFSYFSKTFKDYTGKTPNEYRVFIKSTQF